MYKSKDYKPLKTGSALSQRVFRVQFFFHRFIVIPSSDQCEIYWHEHGK